MLAVGMKETESRNTYQYGPFSEILSNYVGSVRNKSWRATLCLKLFAGKKMTTSYHYKKGKKNKDKTTEN